MEAAPWLAPLLLAGALLAFGTVPARAQGGVELIPTAGYLWGGTLDYVSGSLHIEAAPEYGGMISAEVRPNYYAEIGYWYQGSEITARPRSLPNFTLCDLTTHYIQLGGSRPLGTRGFGEGGAVPFATGSLGVTIFDPSDIAPGIKLNSMTVFSIAMGGGLRVDVNEKIALRMQARLLVPMQLWSSGIWFGTGGAGISAEGTAIAQGDAFLGLVIKMGS
jgi:hypothetical protein